MNLYAMKKPLGFCCRRPAAMPCDQRNREWLYQVYQDKVNLLDWLAAYLCPAKKGMYGSQKLDFATQATQGNLVNLGPFLG